MADPLDRFDPPARCEDFLSDLTKRRDFRREWSRRLNRWTNTAIGAGPSNYYNPLVTPTPTAKSARLKVEWTAFPKRIEDDNTLTQDQKFQRADERARQNEYCEWIVERSPSGAIVKVTFITELMEYWQALWDTDPQRVLELYRELVSSSVQLAELETSPGSGVFNPDNTWNSGGAGGNGAVHMIAKFPDNTLVAALGVVEGASTAADDPLSGDRFHADPLIATTTLRAVHRLNVRVSLTDPVGVYLQEPEFHRFELPASAPAHVHPQDFWKVTRGFRPDGCAMRAEFAVPAGLGFGIGEIKIDGRPIRWGSQIARTLKSSTYVTPIPKS